MSCICFLLKNGTIQDRESARSLSRAQKSIRRNAGLCGFQVIFKATFLLVNFGK